jgi:hypothetical protein
MEISFAQFIFSALTIAFFVWISLRQREINRRQRETDRLQQEVGNELDELTRVFPWIVYQRNILARALWLTGWRGISQVTTVFSDGATKDVILGVTANGVTIRCSGEEEYAVYMDE